MTTRNTTVTVELEETVSTFTLRELCERGNCHAEFVIKLVSYGVLSPVEQTSQAKSWSFDAVALTRLHKAQRLQRDLKINLPGLAMTLDLLDEVHDMRREVDRLNHMLTQFMDR